MRIGFLTYGLDRSPTGIGRYAIELLRAMVALPGEHKLILLTTEQSDQHGLWRHFEHHALSNCRTLPQLLSWGNVAVGHAAARYKLDIVHDPNGIAPYAGPARGTKRLVTIHDAFPYVYPASHNWLDNWRYRWMLPWVARRADVVLTDSECSRRDLIHYLALPKPQVRTIYLGGDLRFRPVTDVNALSAMRARYKIEHPYLLYVGGVNARKNIARLLEAFAQVRARQPDVRLVIGGKRQWQTGEIDRTFQRLNLADAVQWTGYVRDEDLPALYSGAAAFVFPSLYEGFGLPPLEAMACGTPVITSNVSSLPEVVGDAALTVDPYDVGALAAAIERALTDEPLRAELRARGLARAAQFTWERAARDTMNVYRAVLDQRWANTGEQQTT